MRSAPLSTTVRSVDGVSLCPGKERSLKIDVPSVYDFVCCSGEQYICVFGVVWRDAKIDGTFNLGLELCAFCLFNIG